MDDTDRTVPRRQALRIGGATLFGIAGLPNGIGIGAAALERTTQGTGRRDRRRRRTRRNAGRLERGSRRGSGRERRDVAVRGAVPRAELRVGEGETLRISLENRLSEGTTIHWHGVPVPNPMDGVPDVTQAPVSSDETFEYEYEASPAGTYVYHSHVGLQLDRGLYGPLIVEESRPTSSTTASTRCSSTTTSGRSRRSTRSKPRRAAVAWAPMAGQAETATGWAPMAGQAEMATGWAPMAGQAEMATDAVTVADRTMEWDRVETEVETQQRNGAG